MRKKPIPVSIGGNIPDWIPRMSMMIPVMINKILSRRAILFFFMSWFSSKVKILFRLINMDLHR